MSTKTKKTAGSKSVAGDEFRKPAKMQPLKGKKEKKTLKSIDEDEFESEFMHEDFDDLDIHNDDFDDEE